MKNKKVSLGLLCILIFLLLSPCSVKAVALWDDSWFEDYFSDTRSEDALEVLNERQLELLDRGLVKTGQRVACNSYTITLDCALSDGYRSFAKFTVETPKGTVLDGEEYYMDASSQMIHSSGEKMESYAGSLSAGLLENKDPADNRLTLFLKVLNPPTGNSAVILGQGMVWNIQITGLWEESSWGDEAKRELLAEGQWDFSVSLDGDTLVSEETEVLSKPIHVWGKRSLWHYRFPVHVKITSFRIRALSATLTYDEPMTGYWEGIQLGKIYVVRKDGTKVEAHWAMGANGGDHWEDILLFAQPMAAEEIAYVEFPNGQKVYISEDAPNYDCGGSDYESK